MHLESRWQKDKYENQPTLEVPSHITLLLLFFRRAKKLVYHQFLSFSWFDPAEDGTQATFKKDFIH